MISLTIGISEELQLQVTEMQKGLRHGDISFSSLVDERVTTQPDMIGWDIKINKEEIRAIAQAFTHLADMLDAEKAND